MNSYSRRSNKKIKRRELRYRVLKNNFNQDCRALLSLNQMNSKQLHRYLKKENLKEEAQLLRKEGVDGEGFMVLFSESEGQSILESDIGLDTQQILNLKRLYYYIFNYRSVHCVNFSEEETPFYTFDEVF